MNLDKTPHIPTLIKLILMGFTGAGKSTALVSLAIPGIVKDFPGYRLRVYDFDGKFKEVAEQNLDARLDRTRANRHRLTPINQEQYDAARANIDWEPLREKTKFTLEGELKIIGSPQIWKKTAGLLDAQAKDDDENTITVFDSWTHMCKTPLIGWCMAMQNMELYQFGQKGVGRDSRADYICPQSKSRAMMTELANRRGHVIICAHQGPIDIKMKTGARDAKGNIIEEVAHSEMAMLSVGSAGRIELPSEFNHTLVTAADAEGNRKIYTKVQDGVTTKTPFFARAEESYSLNDGLARYWMLANSN